MKLWLIKFGKALSAVREEGLWRGGARVLRSFLALFRRVGSGDVLFITGGLGDSARYRTSHVAEELELHGFACSVTVQDNPLLSGYAEKFKAFIFHRVLYTPSVARLMERIKTQGKEIIFETDDLVFDAQYLRHMDHFRRMNVFERKQYEGGVGAEILADPSVKVCTASTEFLAGKLRERGKRVFVVKNKLSRSDIEAMERVRDTRQGSGNEEGEIVRIGYFSGAKGHDKDFATVSDVLLGVLRRHEHVRLFIAGPLTLDDRFGAYSDHIERIAYVPREEHFANIAAIDINIAPLEIGNPFCESKSELKFFEAGYLGVPTVAAATEPFRLAISDGVDGFVAATDDEWREKLEMLIVDADLRRHVGEAAHEKVLTEYTTRNAHDEEYYEYLRSVISKR